MKTQRFGIEIEMTGLTRSAAAKIIAGHFGTSAVHIGGGYDTYTVRDNDDRQWKLVSDASIRCESRNGENASKLYSVEFVSPICHYEDIETIQELVRKLRLGGAKVNSSCGIHVHVDASTHNAKTLRNIVNIMASKEDLLYKTLQVNVSRQNYCQKMDTRFLDEINAAAPLVQAGMYQLVLDRRVGEYELPAGWKIIAAGNRKEDRAVTFRLSSALANRFIHLNLDVDAGDWQNWALAHNVHPVVRAFLHVRHELLYSRAPDEAAFASPRSWEMASDVIRDFGSCQAAADVLPGIIGSGPAIELGTFERNADVAAELEAILADPEGAPVPEALDRLWALVSFMGGRGKEEAVRRASPDKRKRAEAHLSKTQNYRTGAALSFFVLFGAYLAVALGVLWLAEPAREREWYGR